MRWNPMPGADKNNGYCLVANSTQTRNTGEEVVVDDFVIDCTSGFGACDRIPWKAGQRNLNLGECKQWPVVDHLYTQFGVTSYPYNPYELTSEENAFALEVVKHQPVDTVTSFSILNVIEAPEEREQHIALAHRALRDSGVAFFTVFRRKNTGQPDRSEDKSEKWFQANKPASAFLSEVQAQFGQKNAWVEQDDIGDTIVAVKRSL